MYYTIIVPRDSGIIWTSIIDSRSDVFLLVGILSLGIETPHSCLNTQILESTGSLYARVAVPSVASLFSAVSVQSSNISTTILTIPSNPNGP